MINLVLGIASIVVLKWRFLQFWTATDLHHTEASGADTDLLTRVRGNLQKVSPFCTTLGADQYFRPIDSPWISWCDLDGEEH
jgi:hypothetical protein